MKINKDWNCEQRNGTSHITIALAADDDVKIMQGEDVILIERGERWQFARAFSQFLSQET